MARTCMASPIWKARCEEGMGAFTEQPFLFMMYNPEVGSGFGTSSPPSVYMADTSPAESMDRRHDTTQHFFRSPGVH